MKDNGFHTAFLMLWAHSMIEVYTVVAIAALRLKTGQSIKTALSP